MDSHSFFVARTRHSINNRRIEIRPSAFGPIVGNWKRTSGNWQRYGAVMYQLGLRAQGLSASQKATGIARSAHREGRGVNGQTTPRCWSEKGGVRVAHGTGDLRKAIRSLIENFEVSIWPSICLRVRRLNPFASRFTRGSPTAGLAIRLSGGRSPMYAHGSRGESADFSAYPTMLETVCTYRWSPSNARRIICSQRTRAGCGTVASAINTLLSSDI